MFYIWRETLQSVRHNGVMSLASVGTVTVSLIVLALFMLLAINLDHVAANLENQVEIKAYMANQFPAPAAKATQEQIRRIPGVTQAQFVSKEQALQTLKQQLGKNGALLESVEERNPLPASFQVRVDRPENVKQVSEALKQIPGVEKVDYQEEVVQKLFSFTKGLRLAGLALVVVLAGATVFIISNTIRLTVFARRREIAIMKLVGATDRFIHRPFMAEGMLFGVAGGMLAAFIVWAFYSWAARAISQALPFLPVVPAEPVMNEVVWILLLLGAALGAIGSLLAIRRFLRV